MNRDNAYLRRSHRAGVPQGLARAGPRAAAVVFLHGFGEHSGLYHQLGNTLNNTRIELWALDEIGHGLTEGDRAVIRSIDDLVQSGREVAAAIAEFVLNADAGSADVRSAASGHLLPAAQPAP